MGLWAGGCTTVAGHACVSIWTGKFRIVPPEHPAQTVPPAESIKKSRARLQIPVLPKSLRLLWSDVPLPQYISNAFGLPTNATMRDFPSLDSAPVMTDRLRRLCDSTSIKSLVLSVRAWNGIQSLNVETVAELLARPERDLLRMRNFGIRSLREIKAVLCANGLPATFLPDQTLVKRAESFVARFVAERIDRIAAVKVFHRRWPQQLDARSLPVHNTTRKYLERNGLLALSPQQYSSLTFGDLPGRDIALIRCALDFCCVAEAAIDKYTDHAGAPPRAPEEQSQPIAPSPEYAAQSLTSDPWGVPRTPLLPGSLGALWPHVTLPPYVAKAYGLAADATMHDLTQSVLDSVASPPTPAASSMGNYLNLPIEALDLSIRCVNCLAAARIKTVGELLRTSDNDLLRFRNFGRKSLSEIKTALASIGIPADIRQGALLSPKIEAYVVRFVEGRRDEIFSVPVFTREWPDTLSALNLPLRKRTMDELGTIGVLWFSPARLSQLTFGDLLRTTDVSVCSVLDFSCVAEAAMQLADCTTAQSVAQASLPNTHNMFQLLAAWAGGEKQQQDFSKVLPPAQPDWPNGVRDMWETLRHTNVFLMAGDKLRQFNVPELVMGWLHALDTRSVQVLDERVLTVGRPKTTIKRLGERFRVTGQRVQQIGRKLENTVHEFHRPEYRPVMRRAKVLRHNLGSAIPADAPGVPKILERVTADIADERRHDLIQRLFLQLAGPYVENDGWLLLRKNLAYVSRQTLRNLFGSRVVLPAGEVTTALNELGIWVAYHDAWIQYLNCLKYVDAGYLWWRGTMLDKAAIILQYAEQPLTDDEIAALMGISSGKQIRFRLTKDPRFWRINNQKQLVLAGTDGYVPYTSVSDAIIRELDANGGAANARHLADTLSKSCGVRRSTVLAVLKTPLFSWDDSDSIRVRKQSEIDIETDIASCAHVYKFNSGWAWRFTVDAERLRGSGRPIPNAMARELGCEPQEKITTNAPYESLTVHWQLSSIAGATIGSMRHTLQQMGAEPGDQVFLVTSAGEISFLRIPKEIIDPVDDPVKKLAYLVGVQHFECSQNALLQRIGRAIGIDNPQPDVREHVRKRLETRGEKDLAALLATT